MRTLLFGFLLAAVFVRRSVCWPTTPRRNWRRKPLANTTSWRHHFSRALRRFLEQVERHENGRDAPPVIDWGAEDRKHQVFVRPDGENVSLPTEFLYKITVRDDRYRYRFHRIRKMSRTGVRRHPFVGVVEFEVATILRTARATPRVKRANSERIPSSRIVRRGHAGCE